jgi:hypothetical protein
MDRRLLPNVNCMPGKNEIGANVAAWRATLRSSATTGHRRLTWSGFASKRDM